MRPTDRKGQGNGEQSSSRRTLKDLDSFLAQDPCRALIGSIFEESSDQLYGIFRRLDKLRAFALNCLEEQKSNKMSEDEYDAERRRWASELDYLTMKFSPPSRTYFCSEREYRMQDITLKWPNLKGQLRGFEVLDPD